MENEPLVEMFIGVCLRFNIEFNDEWTIKVNETKLPLPTSGSVLIFCVVVGIKQWVNVGFTLLSWIFCFDAKFQTCLYCI